MHLVLSAQTVTLSSSTTFQDLFHPFVHQSLLSQHVLSATDFVLALLLVPAQAAAMMETFAPKITVDVDHTIQTHSLHKRQDSAFTNQLELSFAFPTSPTLALLVVATQLSDASTLPLQDQRPSLLTPLAQHTSASPELDGNFKTTVLQFAEAPLFASSISVMLL